MPTKIGILGVNGRMGRAIALIAENDPEIDFVGGISRKNSAEAEVLAKKVDVLIDFSSPDAVELFLEIAQKQGKPLVLGTTGLKPHQKELLKKASVRIPLLYSANFSLGMALLKIFAKEAAKNLQSQKAHIHIIETHHAEKKDAPSGSALKLQEEMQPFYPLPIPIHALRAGKVTGEHSVQFHLQDELIELSHKAFSRDAFARGALASAKFLAKQKPGFYSIHDVLF